VTETGLGGTDRTGLGPQIPWGISRIRESHGFKIVYDQSYPPATVDFTSIVLSIKVLNPDLVYIASYPPDTAGMLRAIYEVGLTANQATSDHLAARLLEF
jgi:ABC-type branched-subunit amino acid transport system substrate-binding protein